jgi:hypothetical protein
MLQLRNELLKLFLNMNIIEELCIVFRPNLCLFRCCMLYRIKIAAGNDDIEKEESTSTTATDAE